MTAIVCGSWGCDLSTQLEKDTERLLGCACRRFSRSARTQFSRWSSSGPRFPSAHITRATTPSGRLLGSRRWACCWRIWRSCCTAGSTMAENRHRHSCQWYDTTEMDAGCIHARETVSAALARARLCLEAGRVASSRASMSSDNANDGRVHCKRETAGEEGGIELGDTFKMK